MRSKKEIWRIVILVVSIATIIAAAIVRALVLFKEYRNDGEKPSIAGMVLFLLSFAVAISAIVLRKEIVGLVILIFTDFLPSACLFLMMLGVTGFSSGIGEIIKVMPENFVAFINVLILSILLIVSLTQIKVYKNKIERKWIFIPPAIFIFFFFLFQGVGNGFIIMALSYLIAMIISLIYGYTFFASAIIVGGLGTVTAHMIDSLSYGGVANSYTITFWVIGHIKLVASIVWLIYEGRIFHRERTLYNNSYYNNLNDDDENYIN